MIATECDNMANCVATWGGYMSFAVCKPHMCYHVHVVAHQIPKVWGDYLAIYLTGSIGLARSEPSLVNPSKTLVLVKPRLGPQPVLLDSLTVVLFISLTAINAKMHLPWSHQQ
ncbi:hypothetical protein CHU98_g2184 [Xylaria longipes]|nr:hypothetical protein CHU98_g2184 [Xylaria longipes]